MNRFAFLLVVLIVALAPAAQANRSQSQPQAPTGPAYVMPGTLPEVQLAVLQEGAQRGSTDTWLIHDFGAQLGALQGISGKDRAWIANAAIYVHDQLQKKGIDEAYLSILQHVNQAIPMDVYVGRRLTNVFSEYMELRIGCNGADGATATIQHWISISENRIPNLPG